MILQMEEEPHDVNFRIKETSMKIVKAGKPDSAADCYDPELDLSLNRLFVELSHIR